MGILGLDVGSTGCKSIVFDEKGAQISYAYQEYSLSGSVYQIAAEEIWRCVCRVIKETTAASKIPVRALAVSSFGETFVALDEQGEVLAPSLLYTDPRGLEQCEKYIAAVGKEKIMGITGVNPHHMFSLPKIGWFRENQKELFQRTKTFLLMGDFIVFKLTGEKYTDYSLASRTMAFNVLEKKWDNSLLQLAGIHSGYLPKAVPAGSPAGRVLPQAAAELGLTKDTLVVVGGHDQVCAATGAGVTKAGLAINSTGTVECITPAFAGPRLKYDFLKNNYACVPHSIEDLYVTYAFNFTGGSLLKWYRNNFAKWEWEQARKKGVSVYGLLDDTAAPEPTEVIVIPHFVGSGTPDMNVAAKGGILGLRLDLEAPVIYRAFLEGVAYETLYNVERLAEEASIYIEELRAAGGGARSRLWLQIKADILGCPIIPLGSDEAGIIGAALLAAVAREDYSSIDEALPYFMQQKEPILPRPKEREIYLEKYEQYKLARAKLSEIF